MAPIEIKNLSKSFGAVHAVRDLSFDVAPGRVTGFLGPNGAGKSTTLRMVLGLIRPTGGDATIHGRHYDELDDPTVRVGAMLEDTSFHPGRSGRDHLRVLAAAGGHPMARVDELIDLVELRGAEKRRVKGYSQGMRQRLAIASALIGDPDVLILDEPTNGLDPAGIRWLRGLMRQQASEGRTVLVSSHLLAEVAAGGRRRRRDRAGRAAGARSARRGARRRRGRAGHRRPLAVPRPPARVADAARLHVDAARATRTWSCRARRPSRSASRPPRTG